MLITETLVTSLPVPAVVGIAITGIFLLISNLFSRKYLILVSIAAIQEDIFAQSSILPPPNAITKSTLLSFIALVVNSTSSIVGFALIPKCIFSIYSFNSCIIS